LFARIQPIALICHVYSALIAAAWDIDMAYEGYRLNPCEQTKAVLDQMGLNYDFNHDDANSRERYMEQIQKILDTKRPNKIRDKIFDPFGVYK
ncbi:MAG: hypothetical protein NC114_11750, partial [Ruminococcus flavefaciens]|nr:hypothetical protein [Ruminococcus flavefaciens]